MEGHFRASGNDIAKVTEPRTATVSPMPSRRESHIRPRFFGRGENKEGDELKNASHPLLCQIIFLRFSAGAVYHIHALYSPSRSSEIFPGPTTSHLMCRTEKVKNYFYRVECLERHFHKKRVPVAHRAVPQSRKFQCLEFPALITL